ncbi:MAG: pyridoxamine 5'-phosphate oxidase family protein [Gemmatimonadaceae bacterium]|nr:pyridoxamine 5'-phosphate oxidase family protein [Gemmatimonadaceae bacterium]
MTTSGSPAEQHSHPEFRDLTFDESRALLERHNVGRIAYSFHDRVDIEPIHYAFDKGWLYGRTNRGGKFAILAHNPWCAFEVDEVRSVFDWDSVVVKGHLELLDPQMASQDAYERGLELMRALVPGTFTELDPTPQRSILFRFHASEITGRSSRPGP